MGMALPRFGLARATAPWRTALAGAVLGLALGLDRIPRCAQPCQQTRWPLGLAIGQNQPHGVEAGYRGLQLQGLAGAAIGADGDAQPRPRRVHLPVNLARQGHCLTTAQAARQHQLG